MTSTTLVTPSTFVGAPVSEGERIILLDSLRGIALCGILLMNIPGFALPFLQILDPSIRNELSGPNFYAYYIVELVLEGSQRAIFTMLFGAGMLLFLNRLERKVDGLMVAEYYFRTSTLAFGIWFVQRLHIVMVLGYTLSLCDFRNAVISFPETCTQGVAHRSRRMPPDDDGTRKRKFLSGEGSCSKR
jgi:uncharacterized membrane protein YeiB